MQKMNIPYKSKKCTHDSFTFLHSQKLQFVSYIIVESAKKLVNAQNLKLIRPR